MLPINQILLGDAYNLIKDIPDNSIDIIITDPPYNILGSIVNWDNDLPSVDIYKQMNRVLKYGSFAFIFSAPRLDLLSENAYRLKKAGFNTGFTSIYYTFNSGIPKAQNLSKVIDKRLCREMMITKLNREPSKEEFKEEWKNFREIISKGNPLSFNKETKNEWKSGYQENFNITKSKTNQGSFFENSYSNFTPKPAVEVIIVVQKPYSEKTSIDHALSYYNQIKEIESGIRTETDISPGCTYLNKGKIPFTPEDYEEYVKTRKGFNSTIGKTYSGFNASPNTNNIQTDGRFPANLLVSDDALDSSSKYFSLDNWFDNHIKNLPINIQNTFPFIVTPKPSSSERNIDCQSLPIKNSISRKYGFNSKEAVEKRGRDPENEYEHRNNHASLKSIKLISYLITIGSSRKEDIILDLFAGSGTLGVSCILNNRKFICFEKDPDYYNIAKTRIEYWNKKYRRLF